MRTDYGLDSEDEFNVDFNHNPGNNIIAHPLQRRGTCGAQVQAFKCWGLSEIFPAHASDKNVFVVHKESVRLSNLSALELSVPTHVLPHISP